MERYLQSEFEKIVLQIPGELLFPAENELTYIDSILRLEREVQDVRRTKDEGRM